MRLFSSYEIAHNYNSQTIENTYLPSLKFRINSLYKTIRLENPLWGTKYVIVKRGINERVVMTSFLNLLFGPLTGTVGSYIDAFR